MLVTSARPVLGFSQRTMSWLGNTPSVIVPHAESVDSGQDTNSPCPELTLALTRATLQRVSSRSPPRPPGAGVSKVSQNAGASNPHPGPSEVPDEGLPATADSDPPSDIDV